MFKLPKVQSALKRLSFDAVILFKPANVRYVTGFPSGFVLVDENKATLFVPEVDFIEASETVECCEVKKIGVSEDWIDVLRKEIAGQKIAVVGIEKGLSIETFTKLEALGIRLERTDFIENLRSVKDQDEVNLIRQAVKVAEKGLEEALNVLKEGVREVDIAAKIEFTLRVEGSEDYPFNVIVASGARAAYPHGRVSNKQLRKGEPVVIDIGARVNGYCSDITRTFFIGGVNDSFREVYEAVTRAQEEVFERVKPGVKCCELDKIAREVLGRYGLAQAFVHGLGHGLGLEIHEKPTLNPKSHEEICTGNVLTVEPGVYIRSKGGVRVEDDVLVTSHGVEIITKFTRELLVV
ncbi:MAG: hypothetical protein DRJ31_04355 [Candidatus Methanomethylicota archaeon]|uniref:Aminopeptidase P family protein n=1 Tax=Thermoproteota archaeon TaxID=2056631 RepID=A0A497ESA9_9CREN|nr:MAG: hypothetical protein DRJ31_04355 [Candidatus Verstraetearchaeota archaeon]